MPIAGGPKRRILGFDGLRALAVITVFIEHKVWNGAGIGGLGVNLFFALSGYLIVGILHDARDSIESGAATFRTALKDFWIHRAARIFPIYYLTLIAITAYLLLRSRADELAGFGWNFLYLQNFYIASVEHWGQFTHFWTLAIEQQFYLVFSVILLCVPSRRFRVALALIVAGVIGIKLLYPWLGITGWKAGMFPVTYFDLLGAGGLLAVSAADTRLRRWLDSWPLVGLVIACACWSLLTTFRVIPANASGEYLGHATFIMYLVLINFVALNQSSQLVRWLDWAPLRFLGTISYGFYVVHLCTHNMGIHPKALAILTQFALITAMATLSWYLIERPIMRWGRRLTAPTPEPLVEKTAAA